MALRKVTVESGIIEGCACGDNAVTVFKGVPYAAPPTGKLRWREPQPVKPWEGVYKAFQFKSIIAQVRNNLSFYCKEFYPVEEEMSEDGLYLNVWTPAERPEDKLPVMLFIHGGGYECGYSYEKEIDGEGFAKRNVILVSITYRMGALGFLAHPQLTKEGGEHSSGNYGTLDQIAAIKWVRRNISEFGGDPDNITIFGQSAGGMSVCNLVTTSLTKGDVAKAIMMSGGGYTGIVPGVPGGGEMQLRDAEKLGKLFLEKIGAKDIDEARKMPVEKILEVQEKYFSGMMFRPCVDGYVHKKSAAQTIFDNEQHAIPYMVGHTSLENGSYCSMPEFLEDTEDTLRIAQYYGKKSDEFLKAAGYDVNPQETLRHGWIEDMMPPAIAAWCRKQAERNISTYYYRFNRQCPGDGAGAFHSSELWFVFHTIHRSWRPFTGLDYDLANDCCSYFANFAKNGDPNGVGLENWRPYSLKEPYAMDLGDVRKMIDKPLTERQKFIADVIMEPQEKQAQ